jgi:hypothetical protein
MVVAVHLLAPSGFDGALGGDFFNLFVASKRLGSSRPERQTDNFRNICSWLKSL